MYTLKEPWQVYGNLFYLLHMVGVLMCKTLCVQSCFLSLFTEKYFYLQYQYYAFLCICNKTLTSPLHVSYLSITCFYYKSHKRFQTCPLYFSYNLILDVSLTPFVTSGYHLTHLDTSDWVFIASSKVVADLLTGIFDNKYREMKDTIY